MEDLRLAKAKAVMEDPRRSFLRRPPTSNDADASTSGTTNMESQDRRQNEVNQQLMKLGLPPKEKEIQADEIFTRFLEEAKHKGIYQAPEDNNDIYEVIEEVEEDSEEEYDSDATTEDENCSENDAAVDEINQEVEEKSVRGPTKLKRFWKEHDPKAKVNMEFNSKGQPCGFKSCRLTNLIGYLVKGKEISLAASNWSKVPNHLKEKLWKTIKFYFNIPDCYKYWVMKSADKKWRGFKSYLKRKFYKRRLSMKRNIERGCKGRVPPAQWAWLCRTWKTEKSKALSKKNKATRLAQANALHTAGTRSFAVVQEQEEIRQGARVSRALLYKLTHLKKDGKPVDDFCKNKIEDIDEKFADNPELMNEMPHEEDLYSTLFPKAQKTTRHGLGLVVGGKSSEKLALALSALHDATEENKQLKGVVDQLVHNQANLLMRSDDLEKKYSQVMEYLQGSQKHIQAEENDVEQQKLAADEKKRRRIEELESEQMKQDEKKKRRIEELKSEQMEQDGLEIEKKNKTTEAGRMRKVKQERLEENSRNVSLKHQHHGKYICNCMGCIRKRRIEKQNLIKGMDVALTTPNITRLVALGTVQNSDATAKGLDGQPLHEYIEVFVNIVYNSATELPRPRGRLTTMENAQAKCINWPRNNVVIRDVSSSDDVIAGRKGDKENVTADTDSRLAQKGTTRDLVNESLLIRSKLQSTNQEEPELPHKEIAEDLSNLGLAQDSIISQSKIPGKPNSISKKQGAAGCDTESQFDQEGTRMDSIMSQSKNEVKSKSKSKRKKQGEADGDTESQFPPEDQLLSQSKLQVRARTKSRKQAEADADADALQARSRMKMRKESSATAMLESVN